MTNYQILIDFRTTSPLTEVEKALILRLIAETRAPIAIDAIEMRELKECE